MTSLKIFFWVSSVQTVTIPLTTSIHPRSLPLALPIFIPVGYINDIQLFHSKPAYVPAA